MNMVNPIVSSVGMQVVSKEDRPTASSLIQTVNNMGRGAGMYLSGMMFANGKYLLPYIITCGLYLSGSLVFYFSFRGRNQISDAVPDEVTG
jgi:predicted MFS family arabinose efflux permease